MTLSPASPIRYHRLTILLHWVMAIAFLLMLASGLAMENLELEKSLTFQLFQWHKSLGVLLLMAFFLRLAVRLLTRIPPLPDAMKPLEKRLAKIGHWVLYVWMIALPLTGWIIVSASPYGLPTIVFGWFEWPHIPTIAANEAIEEFAEETHEILAYLFIVLIGGHIAAVIRHQYVERIKLLPRMGIGLVILLCTLSVPSSLYAATYQVDPAQSTLGFSGTHAGNPFTGKFESWQAAITFDPANLSASKFDVTIDTASAKTGNKMYDGTLPTGDWFATESNPQARFVSNNITASGDATYTVNGTLTIREISQPVSFTFVLPNAMLSEPIIQTSTTLKLDRLAFDIGKKSDAAAEWVSKDIALEIAITATPSAQ